MPESANPMQQSVTVIEIRPFRGGWQCFEGPGVQPYWTGDTAKEDAIGYATARAKFGRGEIVFSITMAGRDNYPFNKSPEATRNSMARTRFLLAEQAQFSIASVATFWQTISHDSLFHGRQLLKQAD